MYWPRCTLTPDEAKSVSKYFDPTKTRRVHRKIYNGFLELTDVQRQPTFPFQIARRCKVIAITGSGDISQFKLQVQDSAGETYFAEAISAPNILGGYNQYPGSAIYPDFVQVLGFPITVCPFVFEPAITLKPNQVLNVIGTEQAPYADTNYRIELCFHVWEYPGFLGSPV